MKELTMSGALNTSDSKGAARARGSASVSRRTLAKGALWSAPVITMAVDAPLASASGCQVVENFTVAVQPPSSTNLTQYFAATVEEFIVPAGVTALQYELAGGGGGTNGNDFTKSGPGGPGDLVIGHLAVVPGTVITVIVGNGGIASNAINAASGVTIRGGGGYGNGGDVPISSSPAQPFNYGGGSGGGGSALLVGSVPVVVAGGGGGGGGFITNVEAPTNIPQDGAGGQGALAAGNGTATIATFLAAGNVSAAGGQGANGGAPGIRANSGVQDPLVGTTQQGYATTAGRSGAAPSGTGGHGGTGVQSAAIQANTIATYTMRFASGGGGGGYAGGASGDAHARAEINTGAPTAPYASVIGGGGGGGSSYVGSATGATHVGVPTHISAGNGQLGPNQRTPGWAKLTYVKCP